jgi:Co/Zn/Cd efflux system component
VIIVTTFPLFKNSLAMLTETTPSEINLHDLKLAIRAIDKSSLITRVYDVNLWKLGGKNCLQCHVESKLDHMEASRKVTELIS